MSEPTDDASRVLAPSSESGIAAPRTDKLLAGTGTTEDVNDTALTVGAQATLQVGAGSVRVTWDNDSAGASKVGTTDLLLPAGGRFDWTVETHTRYVHVEAGDGSSAYEAWVWQSSPGL